MLGFRSPQGKGTLGFLGIPAPPPGQDLIPNSHPGAPSRGKQNTTKGGGKRRKKSQIQVTFSFLPSSLPSGRASNSLWNSFWNSGGELGKLREVLRELWELRENFGNFIPAMARGHPRGFRDFSSSGGRRRLRAFPGIWELLAWTGSGGNGMGAFGVGAERGPSPKSHKFIGNLGENTAWDGRGSAGIGMHKTEPDPFPKSRGIFWEFGAKSPWNGGGNAGVGMGTSLIPAGIKPRGS